MNQRGALPAPLPLQLQLPRLAAWVGTGVICYQTTSVVHGGNSGNFASPRKLTVNGTQMTCNGGNWSSIPAARNGGYCVQTTTGNYSYAYFTMW